MPRLRILSGPHHDELHVLPPAGIVRLGRAPECEIRLADNRASREHTRLHLGEDGIWLEDLGSANGSWVNGTQQQRVRLRIGDIVAIGGTSLRLEDDDQDGDALVQCLFHIQRLLASDDEHMVERSLETLFMVLPATRLSLFTIDEQGELQQGFTTSRPPGTAGHMSHGFARRVLDDGKAIILEQDSDSDTFNVTLREQHVRTALGVPVQVGGRAVAVLLCDNLEEPGRLGAPHLRLMEFAAEALATVFQRADLRRLEVEQARSNQEFLDARRVQEQIFTKDPAALPGPWTWSALYQPARELGGDFYDFHHDDGGTTWIVADVSGKGMPAALVVSMVKAFCKSLYPRRLGPRELLLELDALLRGEIPPVMFLTAAVIHLAPDGTCVASLLGHPPVLVARGDGSVEALDATPGMLVLWPRQLIEDRLCEHRLRLAAEDCILLFTDGLIEAMNEEGDMYGIERVRAAFIQARRLGPVAGLAHLQSGVAAFVGDLALSDDVTLVVGGR